MLNILIVDDEPKIRRGIACIIEEGKEKWDRILEASNGKDAIEMVKKYIPSVVITDIRMPIKDGMDFIKEIREINCDAQIIIISGFRDFDKAKSAIKFKVFEYLLKPIDKNELLTVISKAVNDVKFNSQIWKNENRTNDIEEILDILFSKMQMRRDDDTCFEAIFNEMKGKIKNYFIVYFDLFDIPFELDFLTDQRMECKQPIELCIKENMSILYQNYYLSKISSSSYCAVVYGFNKDDFMKINRIFSLLNQTNIVKQGYKIAIGVGREKNNINDFFKAYDEAFKAAKRNIYYSETGVHFYLQRSLTDEDLFIRLANELTDRILEADADGCEKILKYLFHEIEQQKPDIDILIKIVKNIRVKIETTLDQIKTLDYTEFEWTILEELSDCFDIRTIKQNLTNFVYTTIEKFNDMNTSILNINVKIVKEYIDKNYHINDSLSIIAEKISINPNYLSHIFKKTIGIGFSEYLNNIRIENAKKLLITTDMEIYKIAETVGIMNVGYFTQVFKRHTGMSALKYRSYSKKI